VGNIVQQATGNRAYLNVNLAVAQTSFYHLWLCEQTKHDHKHLNSLTGISYFFYTLISGLQGSNGEQLDVIAALWLNHRKNDIIEIIEHVYFQLFLELFTYQYRCCRPVVNCPQTNTGNTSKGLHSKDWTNIRFIFEYSQLYKRISLEYFPSCPLLQNLSRAIFYFLTQL